MKTKTITFCVFLSCLLHCTILWAGGSLIDSEINIELVEEIYNIATGEVEIYISISGGLPETDPDASYIILGSWTGILDEPGQICLCPYAFGEPYYIEVSDDNGCIAILEGISGETIDFCPQFTSYMTVPAGPLCSGEPFIDLGVEFSNVPNGVNDIYYYASTDPDFDPYTAGLPYMIAGFAGYNLPHNLTCEPVTYYVKGAFIGIDETGNIFDGPPTDPDCRPVSDTGIIEEYPQIGEPTFTFFDFPCGVEVCAPCPNFTVNGELSCIFGEAEGGGGTEEFTYTISNGLTNCDITDIVTHSCDPPPCFDTFPELDYILVCDSILGTYSAWLYIDGAFPPYLVNGEEFPMQEYVLLENVGTSWQELVIEIIDNEECDHSLYLFESCNTCGFTEPPFIFDASASVCEGAGYFPTEIATIDAFPYDYDFFVSDQNTDAILHFTDIDSSTFASLPAGNYCFYGMGFDAAPLSLLNIEEGTTTVTDLQTEIENGLCLGLSDCFSVTISASSPPCPVGIERENVLDHALTVFPVPASDFVQLRFTSLKNQSLQWQVLDITGRQVEAFVTDVAVGKNSYSLEVENWASGVYLVVVNDGENVGSVKIVVE